jgi:hypothetical protein
LEEGGQGEDRGISLRLRSRDLWIKAAKNSDISHLTQLRPTLWIHCANRSMSAYIDWGVFLNTSETRITFRIDNEKAEKRYLPISRDHKSIGLWENSKVLKAITNLFGKKRIFARIIPKGEKPLIVVFNIMGIEQKIVPLRKQCKCIFEN